MTIMEVLAAVATAALAVLLVVTVRRSRRLAASSIAAAARVAALESELAARTRRFEEAAVRQQESVAQLDLLARSVPVGLCYVDRTLSYGYSNPQYRRFVGASEGGIEGVPVAEVLGAGTLAGMQGDIEALTEGRRLRRMRRETGADGRERDLLVTLIPRLDDAGVPVGCFAMAEDVTDRKRASRALKRRNEELASANRELQRTQDQLVQSEKLASIGQLAAGVAHEINNPIGYVQSNVATLDRYVADIFALLAAYEDAEAAIADASLRARVEAARKAADLDFVKDDVRALVAQSRDGITRVAKIVSDLKGYSRSASDEAWQVADIHVAIDSTLNIVHNEIKYKAEVRKDYGALPAIECRPAQLSQVFMNLLMNAAQAIRGQGTITIRTREAGARVVLEFADSGEGIEPAHLARIFEPFFTTKPVGKGTGLGLSVAYGIVRDHGGEIAVHSTRGEGTVFRVFLPVSQPAVSGAAPSPCASASSDGTPGERSRAASRHPTA
jgi:PAS domain S-box-containing protein